MRLLKLVGELSPEKKEILPLVQFHVAAVTNYYKLSDLNTNLLSYFWRLESEISLIGLKSRC